MRISASMLFIINICRSNFSFISDFFFLYSVDENQVNTNKMISIVYLSLFRRIMATICCIFGLPGNILTIIVCMKALCHRTMNFERKVFDLYLAEISILGK